MLVIYLILYGVQAHLQIREHVCRKRYLVENYLKHVHYSQTAFCLSTVAGEPFVQILREIVWMFIK